jgi:proline racemase
MRAGRSISLISCHAEGEAGDVIVGGVLDIPAASMHEKLKRFTDKHDGLRTLMTHEPRGRPEMSAVIIVPPCDPKADAGFLIMSPDGWVPMSGSNTICTTTVLLETGMVSMKEPTTVARLDTAAGLITATAECENGVCKSVSFDNVPAFVYALDMEVDVPGVGKILVDIAYGGLWCVVVQAASLGIAVTSDNGKRLIELGKLIRAAVLESCVPTHPENPETRGVSNVIISEPLEKIKEGFSVKHAVVVPPGRLDRSPCGTGSSCRLAILHARKQVKVEQDVKFKSLIDTMFLGRVKTTAQVGSLDGIVPSIKGRAWITGEKSVFVDPDDPFPEGFQL